MYFPQGEGDAAPFARFQVLRPSPSILRGYDMPNSTPVLDGNDGLVSTDFGNSYDLSYGLLVQPDGRIVVAGYTSAGAGEEFAIARYNSDGSLDTTFGEGGRVIVSAPSALRVALSVALDGEGRLVVSGTSGVSGLNFGLIRLDGNGNLDSSFGGDGAIETAVGINSLPYSVLMQGERIIAAGRGGGADGDVVLVRYDADGNIDMTFGSNGFVATAVSPDTDGAMQVVLDNSGRIVVAGYAEIGGHDQPILVRYTSDGDIDPSFGSGGTVTTPIGVNGSQWHSLAVQPDGRVVAAGFTNGTSDDSVAVARYNEDGSIDTTFGMSGTGIVNIGIALQDDEGRRIVVQDDGAILVTGHSWNGSNWEFLLLRLNRDGEIDTSFGDGDGIVATQIPGLDARAFNLALQQDGRIVVSGHLGTGLSYDFALLRYNADGSLDTTFDTRSAIYIESGEPVALDPNASVFDTEASMSGSYAGATLVLERATGADADDMFDGSGRLGNLIEGGDIVFDSVIVGTVVSNSGGRLELSFNANATQHLINSVLRSIAYQTTAAEFPDGSTTQIRIAWMFSDGAEDGAATVRNSTVVLIQGINSPPSAAADEVATNEDSIVSGNVLANDTDPDAGDMLTVTNAGTFTTANGGTVVLSANGDFTYTPTANWSGTDNFEYTVADTGDLRSNATTTIEIAAVGDAPIIRLGTAGVTSVGQPFQINQSNANQQWASYITALQNDRFLISWSDVGAGIRRGQLLGPDGIAIGENFDIMPIYGNGYDSGHQLLQDGRLLIYSFSAPEFGRIISMDGSTIEAVVPHMSGHSGYIDTAALAGGGFVVAASVDGYENIGVQAYDASGQPVGPRFSVSSGTYNEFVVKDVLALGDGGYVLLYDQAGGGLKAQLFDANGQAVGDAYLISASTSDITQDQVDSALLPDGRAFVCWAQAGADGSSDIFGRFLNADGMPLGDAIVINRTTTGSQQFPHVVATSDGVLNISWLSGGEIHSQFLSGLGAAIGPEVVLTQTINVGWVVYPVATSDGGIFFTWRGSDGSGEGVPGRYLSADGQLGPLLILNTDIAGTQMTEPLAINSLGTIVASFLGNDGSGFGVFAQVLTSSVVGNEDSPTALPVSIELTDTDGSEAISSILLTGMPVGFSLSAGSENSDGSWSLTLADLHNLTIYPARNYSGTFTLTITATAVEAGNGSSASSSTNTTVIIVPTNDSPSSIAISAATIAEFAANGTVVGILSAIDPDVADTRTFSLTSDAGGRFVVVGNELRVADGLLLDFEQQPTHTIRVRVTDAAGASFETDLVVNLTDVAPEFVIGDARDNTFVAGAGIDRLRGGEGADRLEGGGGNDIYDLDRIEDRVIETADGGTDIVTGTGTFDLDLERYANVENANLYGTGNAAIFGSAGANLLYGNAGDNLIDGRGGADIMTGRDGDDTYVVDDTGDLVREFTAAGGTDTVMTGVLHLRLGSHIENLTLTGSTALNGYGNDLDNTITGNDARNYLDGRHGDDTIYGGGGSDHITGGFGADYLDGGDGFDYARYDHSGDLVIDLAISEISEGWAAGDVLVSIEGIIAGAGADRLTGNGINNVLYGMDGNDVLEGRAGNDTLRGGAGDDEIIGGAGRDQLEGGQGSDRFVFADGWGIDAITDFDELDVIELTGVSAITSFADLVANHARDVGGTLQIYAGGHTITLSGYTLDDLGTTITDARFDFVGPIG